jgi:hypothetical protein
MKTYKLRNVPLYFYFYSLGVYFFLAAARAVTFAQEITPNVYKLAEIDNTGNRAADMPEKSPNSVKIFMSGDVMCYLIPVTR